MAAGERVLRGGATSGWQLKSLGSLAYVIVLLAIWLVPQVLGHPGPGWTSAILLAGLLPAGLADIWTQRIPDPFSLGLMVLGVALVPEMTPAAVFDHAAAIVVGFGLLWGLNRYWEYRKGYPGIGMGDAKLLAAAGAWTGLAGLPFVLLIASSCGLGVALILKAMGKMQRRNNRVAFGPFIAIGLLFVWQLEVLASLRL